MIAEDVLRRCHMPEDEIRWVLTAGEPSVVHMILELHLERLQEELADHRQALGELEPRLTERGDEVSQRRPPPESATSMRTR